MKKKIIEKKFDKKFLKNIEHKGDKNFFASCFEKREDFYFLRENLSKTDAKKLKQLFKVIKANQKGAVKFAPLIIAGAIVAGLVFFFTVIINPLLGRAVEKGLEAIFEAKSDVRGFRLSLIDFTVSIRSVTVANKNDTWKNLFDMGFATIDLNPAAVLRGKIVINEISANEIRFGTQRTTDGALPGYVLRKDREKPKSDAPPLIDLANFDAMALLEQEFDKLNTPKMYDEAVNAYNETVEKWEKQAESAKKTAEDLRASGETVMNINIDSFDVRTPEGIQNILKTIEEVKTAIDSVQNAANEVTAIANGLESDFNRAKQLEQNARNALNDDINRLKSYVDLSSGAAFEALEPHIRDVLSDTAEQYFDYGLLALDVLEKLKASSESKPKDEKPKKQPKTAFKGRNVAFPVVAYPKFYLGKLATDVKVDTWIGSFDLQNVSSDPNLTNRQTGKANVSLNLGLTEDGGQLNRTVAFKGNAYLVSEPNERFNAVVNANGFPVALENQLEVLGIGGLKGESEFSVNTSGKPNGSFSLGADVNIVKANLIEPSGTIAEALDLAVKKASRIDLGVQYAYNVGAKDEFKLTTNIASLFLEALRSIARQYVDKAMAEIERIARQKIDEYLGDRLDTKEQADNLIAAVKGDTAAINQMKGVLEGKLKELEKKYSDSLKAEAAQQLQNILPGGQSGGSRLFGR